MNLKLSKHFQDMMQFRGINLDHVKKAMMSPDHKQATHQGRILVRNKVGTKTIEVIYNKEGFKDKDEYLVITAYYI